jgi:hypothetical protein
MARKRQPETTLYAPVKRYLEALGFTVKGEVCGWDLVALRGDDPLMVIIAELKLGFSLDLVLQGVERTAACDESLACRACGRSSGTSARPTCAQALPLFRLRLARRIVHWLDRSACRAQTLASPPRQQTPHEAGS